MLVPRYYYANTYDEFFDWLADKPHEVRKYRKNEILFNYSEPIQDIFYICSGIAEVTLIHENGHEKILSFHSSGSIFPGCHDLDFKIERSIGMKAITDMEVMVFRNSAFSHYLDENPRLFRTMFNWYASYINLLLYESAHQEYNNSFTKLCNMLYLIAVNSDDSDNEIRFTHEELSKVLSSDRSNISRYLSKLRKEGILTTHHNKIVISDLDHLQEYCTLETIQSD